MERKYTKTKKTNKTEIVQSKVEEIYKHYLLSEAEHEDKTLSLFIYDALRKVHPMPKNWKPKQ